MVDVKSLSSLPAKNSEYSGLSYWDTRYTTEEEFEWCKGFQDFRHLIEKHVNPSDRILVLGCGNSRLGVDLYEAGYTKVMNVDYSSVVIERMAAKFSNMPGLEWRVMDMRNLINQNPISNVISNSTTDSHPISNSTTESPFDSFKFNPGDFDVVIEKGTLDVFFVNEKSPWTASSEVELNMYRTMNGISQLINNDGSSPSCPKFISISFTQPHFRLKYYDKPEFNWDLTYETFGETFHYFFYVATKRSNMLNES